MNIYAIGHSNYTIERLIDMLKEYKIDCVVDIRGIPYSSYNIQFDLETVRYLLTKAGFKYIYMGEELAANRKSKESYNEEGYADFDKVIKEESFIKGIERLKEGIKKGYNICIMGAMQEPIRCHRSILVGRELYKKGINVKYILNDCSIVSQKEIEHQLLDKYYKDRAQMTIDSLLGEEMSEEEMISEAYKKANKEIGYRLEKL